MKEHELPHINHLTEFGFVECGKWKIKDDLLEFDLESDHQNVQNVLYAFATQNLVGYIGITKTTLRNRFQTCYAKPVKKGIRECLRNNLL